MSAERRRAGLLGSALLGGALLLWVLAERMLPLAQRPLGIGAAALSLLALIGLRLRGLRRAGGPARRVEGWLLFAHGVAVAGVATLASAGTVEASDTTALLRTLGSVGVLLGGAAALFMELSYARMPVPAAVEPRRVRRGAQAGLTLALTCVTLVSLNYVATARDLRRDVSYFRTAMPGEATRAMVHRLDADVEVVLFFERGSDVLAQARPYFDALAAESSHVKVRAEDFALQPTLTREHRVRGNGHVLLLTGEADARRGETIEIGAELTAARPALRALDGRFQTHFGKLLRPERSVFLTLGHGEPRLDAKGTPAEVGRGLGALERVLGRLRLSHEPLGIGEGLGRAVPDGSSAVIVMGPQTPLLPAEVASLLAYVRAGGRLLLLLDPDVDSGLAPLLSALGLQVQPGVVASESRHMRFTHGPEDRAIVFSNNFSSHPVVTNALRRQREVAAIFYRGVALAKTPEGPAPAPGGKVSLRFPVRGHGMFLDRDGDYSPDPGEALSLAHLVAAVTVPVDEEREGRVVVIGDGDFITDRLAGNVGNMMIFVDALSWLIGSEALPATAESEEDGPIRHSRDEDRAWFYATTFGVPLPIVVFGLWRSRRRRRRAEASVDAPTSDTPPGRGDAGGAA